MSLVNEYCLTGIPEDGGLTLAFKRYRPKSKSKSKSKDTVHLALIFTHGVGTHKETWEPTIEHLFDLQAQVSNSHVIIEEAWVMDSPNHGHAAALNDKTLLERPEGITAHNWARGVQVLLKSGLVGGTKVVGIGHSAGACVSVLSTVGYSANDLPYSALILIEPPMMTKPILTAALKGGTYIQQLMASARTRKDIWPSRDAAREWFSKRPPWATWHPRVLQLFVDIGLHDLPTASYPDRREGVTLACTRQQEEVGYIYHQDGLDSLERLKELCPIIPVHCILGSRINLVPAAIHKGVTDASQGRQMASIVRVADAGHMVVQENPTGTALAIWGALNFGLQTRMALKHEKGMNKL